MALFFSARFSWVRKWPSWARVAVGPQAATEIRLRVTKGFYRGYIGFRGFIGFRGLGFRLFLAVCEPRCNKGLGLLANHCPGTRMTSCS